MHCLITSANASCTQQMLLCVVKVLLGGAGKPVMGHSGFLEGELLSGQRGADGVWDPGSADRSKDNRWCQAHIGPDPGPQMAVTRAGDA